MSALHQTVRAATIVFVQFAIYAAAQSCSSGFRPLEPEIQKRPYAGLESA
jgi:hypothetical protein